MAHVLSGGIGRGREEKNPEQIRIGSSTVRMKTR
jgi:hypothetical protein